MYRPRFGSVLTAVALATATVVPLFAAPASAVSSCDSGQFPSTFAAQAALKVLCTVDAGQASNHIEIHDSDNVVYHHGGARNVSIAPLPSGTNGFTVNSTSLKFAAGKIGPQDIRRPISAFSGNTSMVKGGTFITSVLPAGCVQAPTAGTQCTSATLSQAAAATGGTVSVPINAKVEHTANRLLVDVSCSAGTDLLTSTSAKFVAADIGKSVSGGPFASGTFITAVPPTTAANTAKMNQTHTNACSVNTGPPPTSGDVIAIGGTTYVAGVPKVFNSDPMTLQLVNNSATPGGGFTCTAGTRNLVFTAGAVADTGGVTIAYRFMSVIIKVGTTTVSTRVVNVTGTNTLNLDTTLPACPSGITATAGQAIIGAASAGAPKNAGAMMTLAAELNLSPSLVFDQNDCGPPATQEGFEVLGSWQNPGAYATGAVIGGTSTPRASVGEVLFPTAVISFVGFIVPKKGGETLFSYSDANPHYSFSFPILPTSLAVCASPAAPIAIAFGINPTTLAGAPFLPTGSGNVGDPPIRQLLPLSGTFSQKMQLITNPATEDTFSVGTGCTIPVDTSLNTSCGDG